MGLLGGQVSDEILDTTVAPELSKLKVCGAKSIRRGSNQFARYQMLAIFGQKKYKKHIHALLVVYFRRVDFARVEYNLGCKQLRTYISKLPRGNSQTRFYRLALCHFETCLLHLHAASTCSKAIVKSLKQSVKEDADEKSLRLLANRIRHFDEDIYEPKEGKLTGYNGIAPIWITDTGLKSAKNELSFVRLRELLVVVESKCDEYCNILIGK
jgi:hypothetical protein